MLRLDILNKMILPSGTPLNGYTPPTGDQIVQGQIPDWDQTNQFMAAPHFDQLTQTLLETPEEAGMVKSLSNRKSKGDTHNLTQEWEALSNNVSHNDRLLFNRTAIVRYKALHNICQDIPPVIMDQSALNGLYEWNQSNARVRLAHMVNSGKLDHLIDKLDGL